MISQKGLDDLVTDYQQALGAVNTAAHLIEDASVLAVDVTGHFGPTASINLINALNAVYSDINAALHIIRTAHPDDGT